MAETKAPGVMLYFDLRPCLRRLNREQKGDLLDAILEYADAGTEPEFEDPVSGIAWDFVKPRIDADRVTYDLKVEKARAAINTRWAKVKGETIPENTDVYERTPTNHESIPSIPTTTTTPSSTPTSSSKPFIKKPEPDGPGEKIFEDDVLRGESGGFTPPTVEEVAAYIRERQSPVDAKIFYDYYQSKGWKIGGTPMTDWRAALRSAESWARWKKSPSPPPAPAAPVAQYSPPPAPARGSSNFTMDTARLADIRRMTEKMRAEGPSAPGPAGRGAG